MTAMGSEADGPLLVKTDRSQMLGKAARILWLWRFPTRNDLQHLAGHGFRSPFERRRDGEFAQ